MRKSLLFTIVFALLSISPAVAQERPQGPPPVLMIIREEIKPGMMASHTRHSSEFVGIFNQLQTPNHRIALVPVAGNENEVVYLNAAGSFSEVEQTFKQTDKKMSSATGMMKSRIDGLDKEAPALHNAMRDMLAVYRPELSFSPGVNIAQMRYFSVTTIRVRPGHDAQYAEYVQKLINVARTKAKVDNLHVAVYQIISGAPGGTYMAFRPMKSLAEFDDPIGRRVREAMSDDQKKDADKAVNDSVMSTEVSTYAFAPNMSYVDKQFAAMDPSFWNPPQTQMAVKPKPRKRAPKPPAPPAN